MYKSKYFDEEFLTSEYNENKRIEFLENILIQTLRKFEDDGYELVKIDALKALQIINLFCLENNLILLDLEKMSIDSEYELFIQKIKNYLSQLIINSHNSYRNPFSKQKYNLSEQEENTIQTLINNLRDKIDKEQNIEDEHKQRIIKKLNEMQEEFNKRISTFDNILGKSMDVLKVLQFARKEVASPLLQDTTNLIKV